MTLPAMPTLSPDLGQRRGQLLVVDDQPINIHVIHQALAADHNVFAATSGEQALAFCEKTLPDLVLLDVVMPVMDGLEVCRRLKQNPDTQNIPVVFITAHQHPEEENICWAAGGVDFVNKPVNPVTLRNRVKAHLTLKFQADMLRVIAFNDGLTHIANRRYFDVRLEAEWQRCNRSGSTLALLMIDIDFFKSFNDRYGHPTGDDCLRRVAAALTANLHRPFDLAARYGGEEFVCLLPDTDLAGATAIAEKLELAVRQLGIEHLDSDVAQVITVSVGAAASRPDQSNTSALLIQQADVQLYQAKQQGRGRVCAG